MEEVRLTCSYRTISGTVVAHLGEESALVEFADGSCQEVSLRARLGATVLVRSRPHGNHRLPHDLHPLPVEARVARRDRSP